MKPVQSRFLLNSLVFILLMSLAMFLSMYIKHENYWDFANYHYYNAFAFLNNRLNYDIVPASVNTFFNPIIELPLYFYIQYFNENSDLIYALQGIWGGLTLFVFYKIYLLFFKVDNLFSWIVFGLACLFVLSGDATYTQLGSSSNELPLAFLILWGLYILLKMIKIPNTQTLKKFFFAGLLMGIALGLKQTVITYCVSAGLMLMVCYKYFNKPFKSIVWFAVGGLLGFLLIDGYFLYKYYVLYQNPFFPFLNGIFHSPYFDDSNYRDPRFLPTPATFFIWPILWNFPGYNIKEIAYFDLRLPFVYVIFMSFLISYLYKKKLKSYFTQHPLDASLATFIILSFFTWMAVFSILRYSVIIEIISVIWFIKLFYWFFERKNIVFAALGCSVIVAVLLFPLFEDGLPPKSNKKTFLEVEEIKLPENTLLKLYNFPTAFVIPEFAKHAQFRALAYKQYNCQHHEGSDFIERSLFGKMRDEISKNHKGPVVIVFLNKSLFYDQDIRKLHKKRLKCQEYKKKHSMDDEFECSFTLCRVWNSIEDAIIEEIGDNYFCRPLKNNFTNLHICVPKELKTQILGEEND